MLGLLALFPFGIVQLGLFAGPPLGGCRFLDMLLIWSLLMMVLFWRSRKTPAHLAGYVVQSRPRVWKRLRHVGHSCVSIPDPKRRRGDQDIGGYDPAEVRTGVG